MQSKHPGVSMEPGPVVVHRANGAHPSQQQIALMAGPKQANQQLMTKVVNTQDKYMALQQVAQGVQGMTNAKFNPKTVEAMQLGMSHAMYMGELFLPNGCWTGNFCTSILEAKAKNVIDQDEFQVLLEFSKKFNTEARHPGVAPPPAPSLTKTHKQWMNSAEYQVYIKK